MSEAEGFTEDDAHPIAGLSVDAAVTESAPWPPPWFGSITRAERVTRWTTDRIQMMNALRDASHGQHLHPEALGALADVILARLPEASDSAEVARLKTELAEKESQLILAREGAWRS